MSWDVVARALFVDNGAAAGLAKFNDQIHGVAKAAPGGTRGLNALEGGLRSLAFEAAGVGGPMGRIAEGLLKFGGGSGLILGAAAGIGLITLAYNALTKESREAAEAQEKLRGEITKTAASRAAALVPTTKLISGDVQTSRDELARLNRERAQLVRQLAAAGGAGSQQDLEFGISDRLLVIDAQRAEYSLAIAQNRRAAVPAAKQEADQAERARKAEAERLLLIRESNLERAIAAGTLQTVVAQKPPTSRADKFEPGTSPAFKPEKFAPREFFVSDLEKAITKPRPEKPDPTRLAAEAVALLGALKQGGAAGILGAGGAIASDLSGLKGLKGFGPIGIGLTVASGFFSLFDHSAERRHREEMAVLTRIRENTDKRGEPGHIAVTVLVNGKEVSAEILQDVMYGIRRAERTNAVPILPPSGS